MMNKQNHAIKETLSLECLYSNQYRFHKKNCHCISHRRRQFLAQSPADGPAVCKANWKASVPKHTRGAGIGQKVVRIYSIHSVAAGPQKYA